MKKETGKEQYSKRVRYGNSREGKKEDERESKREKEDDNERGRQRERERQWACQLNEYLVLACINLKWMPCKPY